MIQQYKIINDPVHGFINIPGGIILDIIQHPLFQRLKEIKQLGLTSLVYPGACHTRLNHALGAMHLMNEAVNSLRTKGVIIDESEQEQAMVAILLHDIGHGPFSHALENDIIKGVSHEEITLQLMDIINKEMNGKISVAIDIFTGKYSKRFLHQLVSSQLDVDRLDYLRRDSFFSGVAEGMIGHERIIKMMTVKNNNLVIEEKGIYSVEKFLISRRLMYWQVYLHKTVIAAEQLLVEIINRAREIHSASSSLKGSPSLLYFLEMSVEINSMSNPEVLDMFARLDDSDVISAIKQWCINEDIVLSRLCRMLVERRLPHIELSKEPFDGITFEAKISEFERTYNLPREYSRYFVKTGEVQNRGYDQNEENIRILTKNGGSWDIYEISDMLSSKAFSQITKKYFLCTPKNFYI